MQGLALTTTNKPLACAVLKHQTPTGTHFDWFFAAPGKKQSGAQDSSEHTLWAARVAVAPDRWPRSGCLPLILLPLHRHRYLRYQGPISGGRGNVLRVDEGTLTLHASNAHGFVATIQLKGFSGMVRVEHAVARFHAKNIERSDSSGSL